MPANHRSTDLAHTPLRRPRPTPDTHLHKENGARLTGLVFVAVGIFLMVLAAWDAGWIVG